MTVAPVLRPEFDAELRAGLAVVGGMFPPTITPDLIDFMRVSYASPPMDGTLRDRGIAREEHVAPGHLGDPVEVSVLRPPGQGGPRPAARGRIRALRRADVR